MNRFWLTVLIVVLFAIVAVMVVAMFRMVGSGAPMWRGN